MAAVMAFTTPPTKRRAPMETATLSPFPIPKRVRHEVSAKTRHEASMEEGIMQNMEIASAQDPAVFSSPSFVATEHSVADSAFTTCSSSKRPKKYLCEHAGCEKAFDRPVKLEAHVRSHKNERPYVCTEHGCNKSFLRSEHLKAHLKTKHSEERSHVCTYNISSGDQSTEAECGKSFHTATRLRRHMAAHEEKEQTRCVEAGCGKVFRRQETLQRHVKKDHLGEKPFQCTSINQDEEGQAEACGLRFGTAGQLKKHQSREHSGLRYFCEMCSPSPDVRNILQSDEDVLDWSSFASQSIRVGFVNYADLQQHVKTVHPPTCADCGKQCESNRALKAHMDIEHSSLTERRHYKCTWLGCERSFTKNGNLKVHIQNVHAKSRNFVCGSFELTGNKKVEGWDGIGCGSAFGTKANLEDHVRTQHLGLAGNIRPSRLFKEKIKAEDSGDSPSTPMDMDELATPEGFGIGRDALAVLTGHWYEDSGPIDCLVPRCSHRYSRDYDLAPHLELTHGWHIDDVNDTIAEQQALAGGQFWIGGRKGVESAMQQQLTSVLDLQNMSNGLAELLQYADENEVMDANPAESAREVEEMQATRRILLDLQMEKMPAGLDVGVRVAEHERGTLVDPASTETD